MKKLLLAGLATGVFMISTTGGLQACDGDEGLYSEGPAYKCEVKSRPIVTAKIGCVDHETFLTEGARVSTCVKGQNTNIKAFQLAGNFYSEGLDYQPLGNKAVDSLKEEALNTMPAAGSNFN